MAGCCIDLTSPVSGRVLRVIDERARVVSSGQPLLEIGDPATLEIVVDLLSSDAVKVRPGAEAMIERWGGDSVLGGRVRLVEPSGFTKISALGIEEQRVNVMIDFTDPIERRRALGDGFRIEARIVVWRERETLKVPVGALARREGGWSVYVANNGRAELRSIAMGRRSSREAQVLQGLSAGGQIILHPGAMISDDARISPRSSP